MVDFHLPLAICLGCQAGHIQPRCSRFNHFTVSLFAVYDLLASAAFSPQPVTLVLVHILQRLGGSEGRLEEALAAHLAVIEKCNHMQPHPGHLKLQNALSS